MNVGGPMTEKLTGSSRYLGKSTLTIFFKYGQEGRPQITWLKVEGAATSSYRTRYPCSQS
jgi:hypothetical protein